MAAFAYAQDFETEDKEELDIGTPADRLEMSWEAVGDAQKVRYAVSSGDYFGEANITVPQDGEANFVLRPPGLKINVSISNKPSK